MLWVTVPVLALTLVCAAVVYHYRTLLSVRIVIESLKDRMDARQVSWTSAQGDLLRGLVLEGISAELPYEGRSWPIRIERADLRLTLWPADRMDGSATGVTVGSAGEGAEIAGAHITKAFPSGEGWRLEGITLTGVRRLDGGDISAAAADVSAQGEVRIEGLKGRTGPGSLFEAVRAVAGAGVPLVLEDLRAEGLPGLKTPHTLEAQRLVWDPASGIEGLREAVNVRLRIQGNADPIVLIGGGSAAGPDLRVYVRSVEVEALKAALGQTALKVKGGSLDDVELHVAGTWREPVWMGNVTLDRVAYGRFEFTGMRVWTDGLTTSRTASGLELRGTVVATGGEIRHTRGRLDLKQGTATYYGDPTVPELDIEGSTKIGSSEVRIRVEGTPLKPQIRLGSDGVFSQDKLLLMLATGQEWPATEKALEAGKATFDVTREFVDYFVLGGSGQRLKDRFGLRDLTLGLSEQVGTFGIEKILPFAGGTRVGVEGRTGLKGTEKADEKAVGIKATGNF